MSTTKPQSSDDAHRLSISILNQQAALPDFAFFQVVRVKLTREVATVIGMKYESSDHQLGQWLYQLDGLTKLSAVWWKSDQLRSLHRK